MEFPCSLGICRISLCVFDALCRYSNTVYLDLWQEVANTLGDNELLNKLNAWTVEEGFPVVKLQWKSGDDNTMAGELTLTQERYFRSEASKQAADPSSKDTVWWIPLHFEAGYPAQDPGMKRALTFTGAANGIH